MNKRIAFDKLISIFVGAVFLFSGYFKMVDSGAFGNLIVSYGFNYLAILAPFIIIVEIIIGLMLIFSLYPKIVSFIGMILATVFTIAFTYAYVFNEVTDCGCFGRLTFPVWFTYLRNVVLIGALFYLWKKSEYGGNSFNTISNAVKYILGFLISLSIFFIGYTYNLPASYAQFLKHSLLDKKIEDTYLPEYVDILKDSTYVLYIFSYSCQECWNSFENAGKYNNKEIADKFIAISVDEKNKQEFYDFFNPEMDILSVDETFSRFVNVVPTLLYIENNTVKHIIQGSIPSVYFFNKNYLKTKDYEKN